MEVLQVESRQHVLTGSLSKTVKIDVNNVSVEDFKAGFDEGGSAHYDFKDISFD